MVEFVVGTGGHSLFKLGRPAPQHRARQDQRFGFLKLRLGRGRYRWSYKLAPGGRIFDAGSRRCTPIGPMVRKHLRAKRKRQRKRQKHRHRSPARVRGPPGIDCRAQTDEEVSPKCRNEDSPPTSPN